MPYADWWQPPLDEPAHPLPVQTGTLTTTPKRLQPTPLYLGAESRHRNTVAGHSVKGEMTLHHAS